MFSRCGKPSHDKTAVQSWSLWSLSLSVSTLDSRLSTPGCDQTGSLQSTPQLLSSVGKIKHFSFRLPTKSLTQFWKLTGKNRNNIDETCHTQNYVSSQKCTFKPSNSENGLTGLWTGLKELFGKIDSQIRLDQVRMKNIKNVNFGADCLLDSSGSYSK